METRSCNTFESYNKIFVCVSVMFMIASNTSCGNAPMSEEAKTIYIREKKGYAMFTRAYAPTQSLCMSA